MSVKPLELSWWVLFKNISIFTMAIITFLYETNFVELF